MALFTIFAMLLGGLLTVSSPVSAASAVTTSSLNLRTGPGLDFDVLRVIPGGASISVDGDAEAGYLPVSYDGSDGFAAAEYIQIGGEADVPADGADPPVSGGAPTGSAWVATDALNFRSGPSLSDSVISVLTNGAAVELTGQLSNGYWQATAQGTTGWLFADYLTTSAPAGEPGSDEGDTSEPVGVDNTATGSATVTSGLNLRSGPGLSFDVQRVMPAGASVELRGDPQGSYYPLSYGGTTGWAHGDWLDIGAGAAPVSGDDAADVGTTATGSATVTSGLNLRSGPGLSFAVQRVMPAGAAVELRGDPQGSYYPLSYNGTTGWAHGDWLDIGAGAAPVSGGDDSADVGNTATGSASVTSGLNLRSGPGLSFAVQRVMPAGASVELRGDPQGSYYPLSYNGTTGWAHGDWLNIGGNASVPPTSGRTPTTPTPEPTSPPDTGTGAPEFLYTTVALNMRSGPSTSDGVVWVIPPNTRVTITGASRNGFYPAEWAHVSGWMHSDYLSANHDGPSTDGNEDIISVIYAAADRYDQPRADMLRVAQCESHLDPNAVNPVSGTSGLFQFRPSTWATTPYAAQDIFDPVANANAAAWMWDNGRRNEWACQ